MDAHGALPGAVEFLKLLSVKKIPYFILSNGSLYSENESHRRCLKRGFNLPLNNYINSGGLVESWIKENDFVGANFMVIGPKTAQDIILDAGGKVVDLLERKNVDVIFFGHQTDDNFLKAIDSVITVQFAAYEQGRKIPVLCPNTDIIYPNRCGEYGITSGSLILLLKEALYLRFPDAELPFVYLGKPYAPIFKEAMRRSGLTDLSEIAMIGDQIHTDVKGANDFGIDSVLIGTGITSLNIANQSHGIYPKYILTGFDS